MPSSVANPAVYTDLASLQSLKARGQGDDNQRLRQVARQFESIFMQMMLKSMRDAGGSEGLFDSNESRTYRDMFDKQVALDLSARGGLGIADLLVRQLGGAPTGQGTAGRRLQDYAGQPVRPHAAVGDQAAAMAAPEPKVSVRPVPEEPDIQARPLAERTADEPPAIPDLGAWRENPTQFIRDLLPHARAVASRLGLHPALIIAQAALETGWGAHVMRQGDGKGGFNLFGIKAGNDWQGDTVRVQTLEFRDGMMRREQARFKSYASLREAFEDYAALLQKPRYQAVLNRGRDVTGFARALQEAGYATDPDYAAKVQAVVSNARIRTLLDDSI